MSYVHADGTDSAAASHHQVQAGPLKLVNIIVLHVAGGDPAVLFCFVFCFT